MGCTGCGLSRAHVVSRKDGKPRGRRLTSMYGKGIRSGERLPVDLLEIEGDNIVEGRTRPAKL